jgi:hypothetical protein
MRGNGTGSQPRGDAGAISVAGLSKTYQVPEREGGFGAAVRSFFHRRFRDVLAVQQVSFSVGRGEVVGFLGPNGAGKTTTLKMLSGLLHPTAGAARVLGFTPWERNSGFLSAITLVMGQRNRLAANACFGMVSLLHEWIGCDERMAHRPAGASGGAATVGSAPTNVGPGRPFLCKAPPKWGAGCPTLGKVSPK